MRIHPLAITVASAGLSISVLGLETDEAIKHDQDNKNKLRGPGSARTLSTEHLTQGVLTQVDENEELVGTGEEVENTEWQPGPATDPLSEDELEQLMSLFPHNNVLKDMSAKPGKGLGRNNINALIQSGKPFLLNGLDQKTRKALEEEIQLKLDEMNQPYVIVVPKKDPGNNRYFHFIEAVAPAFDDLIGGQTELDKKREFFVEFLKFADQAENQEIRNSNKKKANPGEERRKLETYGTPVRRSVHSVGPYTSTLEWCPECDEWIKPTFAVLDGKVTFWASNTVDYYKTSNGHDLVIKATGNWNTNYIFDDENGTRGYCNGHSTLKVVPPDGYGLLDHMPKNSNKDISITETKGFSLSGAITADSGGTVGGSVGATYSEEETVSYTLKEWEYLANGYNTWDFKQVYPFNAYESPMYTDFSCYWQGGCLHYPPALSRGNLYYEAVSHVSSPSNTGTGWQRVYFYNTGRTFKWVDEGWFTWSWKWWTRQYWSYQWIYVG